MRRSTRTVVLWISLLAVGSASAQSAADYRWQAEAAVARGAYAEAAGYYRQEAAVYRETGDVNAAIIEETKAERYTTRLIPTVDRAPDATVLRRAYTGAKHEPVYGCYVGAWLGADERLGGRGVSPEAAFAELVGKKMAVLYTYGTYRGGFGAGWAGSLWRHEIAGKLACEPSGLAEIQDDEHLRRAAEAARQANAPMFLRFACEMNGSWVRWGGNPEEYKRKWRLVHDRLAQIAPNVAMIWCPAYIPQHNIDAFYPGDEYVDWVGVNAYSVYYHDNDRSRPAWFESVVDYVDYVYRRYAARKPMAIGEYGVTNFDAVDRVDRSEFTAAKLAQTYAGLPRAYPRVKMINYFDCNNMLHARAGRKLNNYSLTEKPQVTAAFRRAIAPSYYLSRVTNGAQDPLPIHLARLQDGAELSGVVRLSAWVKTYELTPTVTWLLDGQRLATIKEPGEYRCELDTRTVPAGRHTLTLVAQDSQGREAGRANVAVVTKP